MRGKRDGAIIPGSQRTVTAAEQNAALGLDKPAPKPGKLPPTPAQARRAMSDSWVGDDLDPPDYEASVVSDPETVAKVLGLRPADFDAAPLGSQPEGMPIAQPDIRPKIEPRPERGDEATSSPPPAAADVSAPADELRAQYRAHVAKITAIAEAARGDAVKEAAAAAEVRASAEVGERLKAKLGGRL